MNLDASYVKPLNQLYKELLMRVIRGIHPAFRVMKHWKECRQLKIEALCPPTVWPLGAKCRGDGAIVFSWERKGEKEVLTWRWSASHSIVSLCWHYNWSSASVPLYAKQLNFTHRTFIKILHFIVEKIKQKRVLPKWIIIYNILLHLSNCLKVLHDLNFN